MKSFVKELQDVLMPGVICIELVAGCRFLENEKESQKSKCLGSSEWRY